jgi:DNA helicase-2/ATP-dependent DNA helicase PcrA
MMDVSHILDQLNKPQREAVSSLPLPTLVLAGAGSGKTRVLVHRIAWLLQVENCSPFSILAVTFTNKAAAEMRGRIEGLLHNPIGGLWVGTFHSIAHRLLRRHWQEAHLPQTFQILDSDDQFRMVKRVIRSLDLDENYWPPKQVQWFINARKDEGVRPQYMDDKGDVTQRQYIRIYTAYEEACKQAGVIDFAELLLRSLELIRDNEALLKHYRQRFRHVLVDEFQDTNTLQYAWLRLLAGSNPVFAVGDDDQSIYGWRGAKIENIQNFTNDFADVQTIRLEQNYRSTGNILKAANALIANNDGRLGKNLWTEDGDGDLVDLYAAYNEQDEARYVASRIQRWKEQGGSYAETAILYRSNAQSRVFEMTLNELSIPYRVYGGLRFFERAEIKDALAYLRLTANRNDDPSFERVINLPTRGIGEKTVEVIREYARATGLSLWQATKRVIEEGQLTARASNAVQGFLELVDSLARFIDGRALDEQVDYVIETAGLKNHYLRKEKGEKGQTRVENLNELVSAAQGFHYDPDEEHVDMDFLSAFLSHAALESGEGQGSASDDCVQMMTLHTAKGLEFPLVFLAGMEEGLFPHQMSVEEPGRLEEERRLCYVGITRARQQLVMSYAEQRRLHGTMRYNTLSRFIDELPVDLLNEIRPSVTTWQSSYQQAQEMPAYSRQNQGTSGSDGDQLSIGQAVRHSRFGDGVITDVEGSGSHARVQVHFDFEGSKWLVLSYAKLELL